MKSNPLFHDSTVSQGSNIQSEFEIDQAPVQSGDHLFLKVFYKGESTLIEMDKKEAFYHCSLWLEHRKTIHCQFLVMRGDILIEQSPVIKELSLHNHFYIWPNIKDRKIKWPEESSNEKKAGSQAKSKPKVKRSREALAKVEKDEVFYDNLIKKWDL